MKQNNIIQEKTFAVRSVKVYKYLSIEKKEFIILKQFLRSAASIGANIEEAIGGQSKADFIAKLGISYKEARETKYWIRLLEETDYFTKIEANSLLKDIEEILRIIAKIKISMNKT